MLSRYQRSAAVPFCNSMQWIIRANSTYSQENWYHISVRHQNTGCLIVPHMEKKQS